MRRSCHNSSQSEADARPVTMANAIIRHKVRHSCKGRSRDCHANVCTALPTPQPRRGSRRHMHWKLSPPERRLWGTPTAISRQPVSKMLSQHAHLRSVLRSVRHDGHHSRRLVVHLRVLQPCQECRACHRKLAICFAGLAFSTTFLLAARTPCVLGFGFCFGFVFAATFWYPSSSTTYVSDPLANVTAHRMLPS